MAASKTVIANLALGHLGSGKEIANLDTENSAEARACRRFYETARDEMLRGWTWPFATKITTLTLVEEDPNDEWAYSYRYPTDCLMFRRIPSGARTDTRQSRVPYRVAQDDAGQVIFTDREDAQAEYTVAITDTRRFTSDFTMALSLRLASYIAPSITAGDPFKVGTRAFQLYGMSVDAARANAANEEQPDEDPSSQFERERNS